MAKVGDEIQWDEARFAILDAVVKAVDQFRAESPRAVCLAVSYCEEDARWVTGDEAANLLTLLERGLVGDRVNITALGPTPSARVRDETAGIETADLALLVVSQDYLNSQTYAELRPRLQKWLPDGSLGVLPVVVRRALVARDDFLREQRCLFAEKPLIDWRADPKEWSEAKDQMLSAVRNLVARVREAPATPAAVTAEAAIVPPTSGHLIFISAKSQDYEYAARIYELLLGHGLRVFFSRESLPEMGNADYGREIDDAIEQAAHMIVVTSSRERVMSTWVEREWRLFENERRSGRKPGNLLTVITGQMAVGDLPLTLRGYEVFQLETAELDRLLAFVRDAPKSP